MAEYRESLRGGESKEYYFPNLICKMKEKGLKVSDIAKALGMDYYQCSRKINGIGQFKLKDIEVLTKLLNSTFEELFKRAEN